MSNLFFRVIVILCCITLCFNFIRLTVSGNFIGDYDPHVVRTVTYQAIMRDVVDISADTSILFRSMSNIGALSLQFLKILDRKFLHFNFKEKGIAVSVIKDILMFPVDLIRSVGPLLAGLCVGLFDVVNFGFTLYGDLIKILNHILGFDLPLPPKVDGIGEGYSGGGAGGRR